MTRRRLAAYLVPAVAATLLLAAPPTRAAAPPRLSAEEYARALERGAPLPPEVAVETPAGPTAVAHLRPDPAPAERRERAAAARAAAGAAPRPLNRERDRLARILSAGRVQTGLLKAITDWLWRLVMPGAAAGTARVAWLAVRYWLLVGAAAASAAAALALLVYAVRQARKSRAGDALRPGVPGPAPGAPLAADLAVQPVAALLAGARAAAAAGDHREALRRLYAAVLKDLHARGCIRWQTGATNGAYGRQLARAHPELGAPFRDLTRAFEASCYGQAAAGPAEYAGALGYADRLGCADRRGLAGGGEVGGGG